MYAMMDSIRYTVVQTVHCKFVNKVSFDYYFFQQKRFLKQIKWVV